VEKAVFRTDDHRPTIQGSEVWLEVHAKSTGIHRRGPAAVSSTLTYDLVLEPVLAGVPVTAFPVGAYALLLVLVRPPLRLPPLFPAAPVDALPQNWCALAYACCGPLH
jgi:hypothetical protein